MYLNLEKFYVQTAEWRFSYRLCWSSPSRKLSMVGGGLDQHKSATPFHTLELFFELTPTSKAFGWQRLHSFISSTPELL